jgi:hypothetical protein
VSPLHAKMILEAVSRAHCPLWSRDRPERPQQERCRGNPETDDHRRCHSADRALGSSARLRAELDYERTRIILITRAMAIGRRITSSR